MPTLSKRYYTCYDSFNRPYACGSSTWDNWARWVFLALIILFFFFVCLSISCVSARRRRRAGRQPFYGTGWVPNNGGNQAYPPPHQNPPQNSYYAQEANQAPPMYPGPPAPAYRQENGIELAAPQQSYQPPDGPPPKKGHF